nr:topoisomerase DNA-binding C4 zinc finger domain-containing protein [Paludibacteraceae bacterium]
VDKKMHVQNVQSAMNKYRDNLILGICPSCGGSLQLRSGKYGNFYGCSNYPKCKFTKD